MINVMLKQPLKYYKNQRNEKRYESQHQSDTRTQM